MKAKDEELDIGTGNEREEKRDGEEDRGMQREREMRS